MSRPKHPRKDATHHRIVQDARALGIVVWDTSDLGGQVLDCVMFWRGKVVPVEIKTPGSEHDLTDGEIHGMRALSAQGVYPCVATCIDDVLKAFGGGG
jgi:hypothetical protein